MVNEIIERNQNQNQNQNRNEPAVAAVAAVAAVREEMNEIRQYDLITHYWNESNHVQTRREERTRAINNTDGYHNGYRIHHIRTIQIQGPQAWNELFGRENLNPILRETVQASFDYNQDETGTLPFAGQTAVSLIMMENYRPRIHLAVFIVYLTSHRQFQDGQVIQMEFGEGSHTHQTVERMFDMNNHAAVSQATEYSILHFVADDDEMLDLLHTCFIDCDFQTMRFAYIGPYHREHDQNGYYIANPHYDNHHEWHQEFALLNDHYPVNAPDNELVNEEELPLPEAAVIQILPPPQINYGQNIIHYYDDYNYDRDDNDDLPAQG